MKKILLILSILILISSASFAQKVQIDIDNGEQIKINQIGFRILNANKIPYRSTFNFDAKRITNAATSMHSREITVYKGLMVGLESDDELAAILSHEIAHSVESHNGLLDGAFTSLSHSFSPRKYEYLADKNGVDYMVKAGYNPLAMIVVLNKIGPQTRFEIFSSHPKTSKRLMEVYEYIYKKYPYFLVNNEYIKNEYYQNFLITSYSNREKLKNKIKTVSNKKIRYE